MRRNMNMMLLAITSTILASCTATPEKSPQLSTSAQGTASPKAQAEAEAQKPIQMYYDVEYTFHSSTVTIYNTPSGTMKGEMKFPSSTNGGRQSVYLVDEKGRTTSDTMDIEYDRGIVNSVMMKGMPIPRGRIIHSSRIKVIGGERRVLNPSPSPKR